MHRGVAGRVPAVEPGSGWLVQAGDRPLWLQEVQLDPDACEDPAALLRPGVKLDYNAQDEIHALKHRLGELETMLADLEGSQEA